MMYEDTIHTSALPVNTMPLLGRIRDVLKELGTNSLLTGVAHEDMRIRSLVWLINMQFHGEMATIDQFQEYCKIRDAKKEQEKKERDRDIAEQQQMNEDSQLDSMREDMCLSDIDIHFG